MVKIYILKDFVTLNSVILYASSWLLQVQAQVRCLKSLIMEQSAQIKYLKKN
jgi:hypothetical protein